MWRPRKATMGKYTAGGIGATAIVGTLCFALALALPVWPAMGQDAYYKDKQIRMIVGSAPGGGYDAYARLVAAHWRKHIPGNPAIIIQNMPGAGSLLAANNLFNIAPK